MKKIISCFFSKQKILIEKEKKAVQMERDADRKRAMEMIKELEKENARLTQVITDLKRNKQRNEEKKESEDGFDNAEEKDLVEWLRIHGISALRGALKKVDVG